MRRALLLAVVLGFAAPVASADPPTTHEVIYNRPSGFWTSNRPAVGGSYRWRLLGIGVVLATITGIGMLKLVRRANDEQATRDARVGRLGEKKLQNRPVPAPKRAAKTTDDRPTG